MTSDSSPQANSHVLYPGSCAAAQAFVKPLGATRQSIHAKIGSNATLLMLPSYVTCFRGSSFIQKQIYHLEDPTSSLICLDWFTSGRTHSTRLSTTDHGDDDQSQTKSSIESWSFKKFQSFVEIYISSKRKIRDNLLLLQDHYSKDLGNFTVYASLYLISSVKNHHLMKIIQRLKTLDRNLNQTSRLQHRRHQNPQNGDTNKNSHHGILWCFSELDHLPDHLSQGSKNPHMSTQNTRQPDQPGEESDLVKIGIVRIGSYSTVLVRDWLEKNLIDLVELIGPEFYKNCF